MMNLTYAFTFLKGLFFMKKPYLLVSLIMSFSLSTITKTIVTRLSTDEVNSTLSVLFILTVATGIFIIGDFILGIIASLYEGNRIQSSKWAITVGKYVGLMFYFVLATLVILIVSNGYIALTLVYGPLILTILKEYISIGENIERRTGKKIYIFSVIEKLFVVLEMRFFKTVENKSFEDNKKKSSYTDDFSKEP